MSLQNFLLLDIGNSRLKWNIWQQGARHFSRETQRVDYKLQTIRRTFDNQWQDLRDDVHAVLVVNVAGHSVARELKAWCTGHWGIDPHFVTTSTTFQSVKNGYRDHSQLGVDRWAAVLAAQQLYPDQQVIIIDCGTATTVDVLTRGGQHLAGPIMPGCKMMKNALAANTADLAIDSDVNDSMSVIVENTQSAIVSGVNFAASSALTAIVDQIQQKFADDYRDADVKVIVTGGAAEQMIRLTQIEEFRLEPDLILIGLRRLAGEKE